MKGERNPVRTTAGVQGQEDEPPAASGAERGGFNVGGAGTPVVLLFAPVFARNDDRLPRQARDSTDV